MRLLIKLFTLTFLLLATPAWAATYTLYPTGDTCIKPDATTTNFDTSTNCNSTNSDQALLMKFNIASTGASAGDILQAQLRLYSETRGYSHNFSVSRVLQSWVSNQATWNIYSTGNNWGTAGAKLANTDYTATNQATGAVPNGDYVTVDVTEIVKDILNNTDNGFLVRATAANMYAFWRMVDYTGTDYDPVLTIQTGAAGVPTTYYVRPSGGTCGLGNQCDGLANADYDGSGINEACACATPAAADNLMQGEDIMVIADGEYAGGVVLPAGTSTVLHTKMYGEDYLNCADPTSVKIWANSGNIIQIGSHTNIQCLSVTDHQSGMQSITDAGADVSGNTGIFINADSEDVVMKDVTAYGLYRGLFAQRLGNFTGTNLKLIGNWSSGWDTDGTGDDGYTGTITLYYPVIEYNGCGMDYPLENSSNLLDTANFHHCCSQDQGCYGDGVGQGDGNSGEWLIIGGSISHNTSDGLDTLHAPATIQQIKKVRAEGNAGNQVKLTGATIRIEDSKIIGNCGYFATQSFTATPAQDDPRVGIANGAPQVGYSTLTGTGKVISNETIGTGNGSATSFSGSTANAPIKVSSATISWVQGGSARSVTTDAMDFATPTSTFSATGLTSGSLNYVTGAYSLTFSTPPDNGTTIKFTSYVYNDMVTALTFSDLVINASDNTKVSSASHTFSADDVGSTLTINGGTGFTGTGSVPVSYTISSVTSGSAVLSASAGTTGSTGGTGYIHHVFTGDRTVSSGPTWDVVIDGTGTPNTFKWRKNSGSYTTGVAMTGQTQALSEGVKIKFKTTTGHTLNDTYSFSVTGATFNNCRAGGNPIGIAVNSGAAYLTNNFIYSNGDTTIYKSGSCLPGDRVYSRNNIIIGEIEYNDGSDKSRQFYADGSGCVVSTLFDSDYDVMAEGKPGNESDCTGEGANNLCYSSSTSIGMTTTPGTSYTGNAMDVSLGAGSTSLNHADPNVANVDEFDFGYAARGASWDNGPLERGVTDPTCSDSTQNGLETGIDCGGICAAVCSGTCGNGILESGESCDTNDLNNATCITQGFTGGTLSCSGSCTFVTSACTSGGAVSSSDGGRWCGKFIGILKR